MGVLRLVRYVPALALATVVLGLAPTATAAEAGYFSLTGSMSVKRTGAAAAPLPGGRVLVVGGAPGAIDDEFLSSAEIFDPSTDRFSSAGIGPMTVPRLGAAAAPLPGGRVLIAGGRRGPSGPSLSSAEVFDPATNTFSSAGIGSMSVPRSPAAAARLPDGRVLVVGGGDASADVFDPATNTFTWAGIGSMSVPRDRAAAAPLPDGWVLVVGDDDSLVGDSSAEAFDPSTNSFSAEGIGPMSAPRESPAAASLPNGVLVIDACSRSPSSSEAFDASTNIFSSAGIGPMSDPRCSAAAAPLPGGRVLVAGGTSANGPSLSSAEIFAPVTCLGRQPTVVGRNGPDRGFRATPLADVVAGVGGNDEFLGLAGNDVICGGTGKDSLFGNNGDDTLSGQAGNDLLAGEAGRDILKGGPGKDILNGGPGKDILKGGPGKDVLKGTGKDRLVQ